MTGAIIWLRSWLYLFAFLAWTLGIALVCLPGLLKSSWSLAVARAWIRGIMFLARHIVGITCRVVGAENVPTGPCIIAAQHQSSFETYRLMLDLDCPVFVLKRELVWIPVVGWFMKRIGLVPIDRGAGAGAMRKMLRAAQAALDDGRQIILFPEGTRVPPGQTRPYRPGIVALYQHCDVPVIPMALDSGMLWGKSRILKRPGEITFQFLPALPRGLGKDALLTELRARLDAAHHGPAFRPDSAA